MAEKEVKEAVETEEKVTASLVKAPLTQYSGVKLAGKTGTAEIKKSTSDKFFRNT